MPKKLSIIKTIKSVMTYVDDSIIYRDSRSINY